MTEPTAPAANPAKPSALRRSAGFLWRHRLRAAWTLVLLLLLTIVLQNVEPTTVDLFFWSLPQVPKLALILISMLLGAGLWEAARRVLFKRR